MSGEVLGRGYFGAVERATWSIREGEFAVAIKTLKSGSEETDKVKFLQEAAIMGQFSHPNVVKLHGVVTVGEPVSWQLVYPHTSCLHIINHSTYKGMLSLCLRKKGTAIGRLLDVL